MATYASWDSIVSKANARRAENGALIDRAIQVRDRVNGDVVTPLLNVPEQPDIWAPMPSLVYDAIEANSMRAASVMPTTWCPSRNEGERLPDQRALRRRRALASTHDHSNLKNLARRAYRHIYGYGTMSMTVTPDFTYGRDHENPGRARIELRDPLTSYPEHRTPDDMRPPLDCIYIYGKSPEWLVRTYGTEWPEVKDMIGRNQWPWAKYWDVVEYVDEDWCVIGILGPRLDDFALTARSQQLGLNRELYRYPNRCNGLVPVAAPWRVTLDRVGGAVGHLLGISDWVARLSALEVEAARSGVMPDMVVIGDGETEPSIVGGSWNSGSSGLPNLLRGAKAVQLLHNQPNDQTRRLIDALEGNFDRSAGRLATDQGQTSGALRTGRGISTLHEVASDPRLMEMQDIFTKALQHMNTCVLEMEKAMWPAKKFVVFTGWGADRGVTEYTPGKDFDLSLNGVGYQMPGMDISQISVALPQRVGARLMSRQSAMDADPLIDDAASEMSLIRAEVMEDSLFQMLVAMGQNPAGPINPEDFVRIALEMKAGGDLLQAFATVQRLTQEKQAELAQEPAGLPSPEAQPGMLAPGPSVGAAAGPGPAPAPPPGQGFQQMMAALAQRQAPSPSPIPGPPQTQVRVGAYR